MAREHRGISAITGFRQKTRISDGEFDEDIVSVRVTDIILDDSHDLFKEYGEWNSIGTIFFDSVETPGAKSSINTATSLYSNQKFYPLINELVPLVFLTSADSQLNTNRKKAYYLPSINLWNSQHHNALPDPTTEVAQSSLNDYENAERGNVRRVEDQSTEIDLGEGFNEKIEIHPLQPYIGDNLFEGRWGNSIRLGSTVKNKSNNWSQVGENGDPLIILRNGEGSNISEDSWVPISENINEDKSSLYLTNGQKIPIEVVNDIFDSHTQPPIKPKEYTQETSLWSQFEIARTMWMDKCKAQGLPDRKSLQDILTWCEDRNNQVINTNNQTRQQHWSETDNATWRKQMVAGLAPSVSQSYRQFAMTIVQK